MSWVFRSLTAGLAVALVPVLAAACGSPAPPDQTSGSATSTSGGEGGSGGSGGAAAMTYGASLCGTCVEKMACVSQVNACKADPGCATYLDCLDACPIGSTGDADTTCEKACPAISGSAGQAAKEALIACRTSGPGAKTCTACGYISGPKDKDFTQVCQASTNADKCQKCHEDHCCNTDKACTASVECTDLVTCFIDCYTASGGDTDKARVCADGCYKSHSLAAFELFNHRFVCRDHFCSDDAGCGDAPLDPCVKCVNLNCADDFAACKHDLGCTLLLDCETPCAPTDQACYTACEGKFPAAKPLLKSFLSCGLDHCDIACGGTTP